MFNIKIILLTIFSTFVYANSFSIDMNIDFYDLLPQSEIYIDNSKKLTIKNIQNKDIEFKENDKKLLAYGYSPDFNVWIKFTLKNTTNQNIERILEYDNPLTSYISFYDSFMNKELKDGLFQINKNRKTINPIFRIQIKAKESKVFYIKASSHITTLIIKLNIWNNDKFYEKEIIHQFILALFFGAMFILAIYNLFIYFFTKDISYLYYVLYMFGIIIHHIMYIGLSYIYLLHSSWIPYIIQYASLIVSLPIFALALFTKYFLVIKQYSILNKILNLFLILIPISVIIFIITDEYDKYRNVLTLCLFIYLIFLTIFSAIKKNRQSYFILTGWIIIFIAIVFMFLSSGGIFNIYKYFPYFVEVSLVLEGIVFSIALADRINGLQKEKDEANNQLIIQQENEKERLETQVNNKTKELKLLLKELNHRVKNNMQTIVSLIRLQYDEIDDKNVQDKFITIQNRINAMSHLHELLYKQDNISHINAYEYFDALIEELKESYNSEVNIIFNIKTKLRMEQAIYCGLILNEIITNSLKYAFDSDKGNIQIKLYEEGSIYNLNICDDGKGYDQSISSDSLGLILVNTLVNDQLKGDIKINSTKGVEVNIKWSNYEP